MGKKRTWMKVKMAKLQRQRREWAKPYNTPRAGVGYAGWTIAGLRTTLLAPGMNWGGAVPKTELNIFQELNPTLNGTPFNEEMLRALERTVQSDRLQGKEHWYLHIVEDKSTYRYLLFSSVNRHIFVRICKLTDTAKRSATYDDRERAHWAYLNGEIIWHKEEHSLKSVFVPNTS